MNDLVVLLTLKARDEASLTIARVEHELHKLHSTGIKVGGGGGGGILHSILGMLPGPAQAAADAILAVGAAAGVAVVKGGAFEVKMSDFVVGQESPQADICEREVV